MKILYITEFFWPQIGGIEILSDKMLKTMQRTKKHQFAVITTNVNNNSPAKDFISNIPIYRFPFYEVINTHNLKLISTIQKEITEIKQQFKPDLIHINNCQGLSAYFQMRTSKIDNCPLLITAHGINQQEMGENTVSRQLLNTANWVNAVSNATLDDLQHHMPEITSKSSVIHNGLPPPGVTPSALPFAQPTLLCLGRAVIMKGFDIALKAFSQLHKDFTGLKLIIAGDGPEKTNLEQQARELGIEQTVEFTGWIDPDQVPDAINRATIVLMPSRTDSCPLVALQAAQMKRPVIAAKVGGLCELIKHNETGILVPKEDSTAFADAIKKLLDNPAKTVQMGVKAQTTIEQVFGWEKFIDQYHNLYQQLINGQTK